MFSIGSLSQYRFRWAGLVVLCIGIIALIVLSILDYSYIDNWGEKIFIIVHYLIILGLFIITYSEEKIEDERAKLLRYKLMKLSNTLMIIGITFYGALNILDRIEFNLFFIFYIIEAALVIYQILFVVMSATNPDWMFKEKTKSKNISRLQVAALMVLVACLIYAVIIYKV